MEFLKLNGINTQIHYKPIYQHKIYKDKIISNSCLNSLKFYEEQLTLPLHTKLNKKQIDLIIQKIGQFFNKSQL